MWLLAYCDIQEAWLIGWLLPQLIALVLLSDLEVSLKAELLVASMINCSHSSIRPWRSTQSWDVGCFYDQLFSFFYLTLKVHSTLHMQLTWTHAYTNTAFHAIQAAAWWLWGLTLPHHIYYCCCKRSWHGQMDKINFNTTFLPSDKITAQGLSHGAKCTHKQIHINHKMTYDNNNKT